MVAVSSINSRVGIAHPTTAGSTLYTQFELLYLWFKLPVALPSCSQFVGDTGNDKFQSSLSIAVNSYVFSALLTTPLFAAAVTLFAAAVTPLAAPATPLAAAAVRVVVEAAEAVVMVSLAL